MPKASELKRGEVVELDGVPHIVKHLESKSPSSRGSNTLYKIRFNNLITGQKRDVSVKGDESYGAADFSRAPVLFSYIDDQQYIFMNTEDYSQYALNIESLEGQIEYLTDGLEGITALLVEGNIVAIDLPQSIVMTIEDTAPGIKGASANARTKPALMPTGLTVQVPEYIERGESIKINTADGKYMTRA
ncbi:MAG: elongation factor P-like protein YeiP [Pseudomonadales bacterium]|nr:elongation factor P-like protein YeiP [Pseudomonadales bacterium]